VRDRLEHEHSPQQITKRLLLDFPDDDPEMRVSHEAIYQSLYVQGRGDLRRDLHKRLRTGRALRKPHRNGAERRSRIKDMATIAERPPEVADRAVPGQLGRRPDHRPTRPVRDRDPTLVERLTRFTMLLHLPHGYGADRVQHTMLRR